MTVHCWGRNDFGQLGDGTTTSKSVPTQVFTLSLPLGALRGGIAAGRFHTCLHITKSIVDADVYCWGRNDRGQLGDNSVIGKRTPVKVSDISFSKIALSDRHSCGISVGQVGCWGGNEYGQVGDGTTMDRRTPVWLTGPWLASDVVATETDTCALQSDAVYCWGLNGYGQVGDGVALGVSMADEVACGSAY
jgi:alpha-tubulin suppressor-like RCC1 family protein